MGWGTGEHEGYADEKRSDGSWSGPSHRGGDPDAIAYQAVCSCGWRSEREHSVPPRPLDVPRDELGHAHGPAWEAWIEALEAANDACMDDWHAEHFDPMLGYEPHQHLVLGRSDGGPRHFLNGLPVNAGASLQLLLGDGHWLAIRYEWSWDDRPPRAYAALGAPAEAERQGLHPLAEFSLDPRAILRWPPPRS